MYSASLSRRCSSGKVYTLQYNYNPWKICVGSYKVVKRVPDFVTVPHMEADSITQNSLTWAGEQKRPKGALLCIKANLRGRCCLEGKKRQTIESENVRKRVQNKNLGDVNIIQHRHRKQQRSDILEEAKNPINSGLEARLRHCYTSIPLTYFCWCQPIPIMHLTAVVLAMADAEWHLR